MLWVLSVSQRGSRVALLGQVTANSRKSSNICSSFCSNEDGSCRLGLILLFLALALLMIAAIVVVSLVVYKGHSTFFHRNVSVVSSNVVSSDPICERLARWTFKAFVPSYLDAYRVMRDSVPILGEFLVCNPCSFFRETLALGGNSIDAVVAGAFCLSVVQPQSAGLGGGLILLHFKEDAYFLDALDEAPSFVHSDSKVRRIESSYDIFNRNESCAKKIVR